MSKIISIAQQKGGSGKTTVTANLATYMSSLAYKVLLVDTDPQGSLSMWFNIRENNIADNIIDLMKCDSKSDIKDKINALKTEYDFILIDTAPHASEDSRHIITSSDYVIIPTQLSPPDIWASQPILDIARTENINHILVLNRVPAQGKISSELHNSLLANEIPLAKTTVGNRNSFATSFLYGQGVIESEPRSRAAEEIKKLSNEIMLNITTEKRPETVAA